MHELADLHEMVVVGALLASRRAPAAQTRGAKSRALIHALVIVSRLI
jgi:hypothetical protein